MKPRTLTTDEIRYFRYNGFFKIPWILPEKIVSDLKKTINNHIDNEIEPLVKDYRNDVMRLSAIWQRGGLFQRVMGGEEVKPVLHSLLGPDVELILNRHNHLTLRRQDDKTAMSLELHRDCKNWSRTICTILFFIEETTLENGCTRVVPGSHVLPNAAPGLKPENDPWFIQSGLLEQTIPLPMPAGGMLVIDSMILHAAGKNHTDGTRMSITSGYHTVDEHAGIWDPKRVTVFGERVYTGNDRYP